MDDIVPEAANATIEDSTEDSDIVARLDGYSIRESTRATTGLVGETLTEPVHIPWQGRQSLLFVFSVRI
jgi:hypothetical protein